MNTLDDLKRMASDYSEDCMDFRVAAVDMEYRGERIISYRTPANLFHGEALWQLGLNDYAYGQLNERIGGPNLRWIASPDKCPPDLERTIFNRLLTKEAEDNREYLLRAKGDSARAVLSSDYTVFDNSQFVDLVARGMDSVGDTLVQVFRPSVGDRLRSYILLPEITFNKDYGGLHPGVYIRNSEIGDGAARVTGGLYRAVCSNGVVYGWDADTAVILRHRYYNTGMIAAMVSAAIAEGLRLSEEAALRFVASESVHIEKKSLRPLIDKWAEKYGLSRPVADEWAGMTVGNAGEFGRVNDPRMMDVVNGATYLAQRQEDETFAEAIERMAGEILQGVAVNVGDHILQSNIAEV